MHWYEDEDLWIDFASVMFPELTGHATDESVAASPLLEVRPGMRVLDIACGPAVYVVALARRGAEVTGVDLSPAMLARARAECDRAGVTAWFVRADMREHVEPGAYDLVLCTHTSFGYFNGPVDNLTVLRNAHASLTPGGALLVDVLGKEVVAGRVGRRGAIDIAEDAGGGTVFTRDTILDDWTRLRTDWTLVRGSSARHASIVWSLYSAAELRSLFESAGFVDVECFGGFDGSPYDNRSRRLVVRGIRGE
jgi:SAM-dependent methyltransferase